MFRDGRRQLEQQKCEFEQIKHLLTDEEAEDILKANGRKERSQKA